MKKIETGHLVRVFDKGDTFEGVVLSIKNHMDNSYLKYVSLNVYNAADKEMNLVCVGGENYKESEKFKLLFLREVDNHHLMALQAEKTRADDIKPNTLYSDSTEIYVKTKKSWFTLIRTTAKMAFFEGGRCSLTNITDVRKK